MKDPKKVFLLDGMGALVSVLILGFILPHFQKYIGMPLDVLYLLMFFAVFFCFYSLNCYWREIPKPLMCMRLIVFCNSLYCLFTIFMTIKYFEKLTPLGFWYFFVDIIVIAGLVVYEWQYLRKWKAVIESE